MSARACGRVSGTTGTGRGAGSFYDIALCDDVNMKKGVGQKGALRGRDQTNSATVFLSAGWVS